MTQLLAERSGKSFAFPVRIEKSSGLIGRACDVQEAWREATMQARGGM